LLATRKESKPGDVPDPGENPMSCLKGKTGDKEKPGRFKCKKCGVVSKKEKHLCQPKKIKEPSR
jgi:hypothetical protein